MVKEISDKTELFVIKYTHTHTQHNLFTVSVSELHKVHDHVFEYFLFNLATISASELHKVHDYCVFDYFLFNFFTISGGELRQVHDYYLSVSELCYSCIWMSIVICFLYCQFVGESANEQLRSVSYAM